MLKISPQSSVLSPQQCSDCECVDVRLQGAQQGGQVQQGALGKDWGQRGGRTRLVVELQLSSTTQLMELPIFIYDCEMLGKTRVLSTNKAVVAQIIVK